MLNVLFRARKRDNPFGWIPDVPDFRDFRQSLPTQLMTTDLPPSADLRAFMPPVYDQGQLGSCTAQTMAAAVEYDRIKRGKASRRPSTLFLYYNSRLMEGTVNEDAGATLRTAAKVVNEYGAPPESYWPYRIPRYARRPYASAYRSGQVNQALRYARVDQTEQALKATLASGLPIAFGFAVYDSLMTQLVARTGVVPMPSASERMRGGHAVLMCGYTDSAQRFLCRNSWGADWGLDGYFWLPYAYVTHPDLAADFWTVEAVER